MNSLQRLDDRVLSATRGSRAVLLMRRQRVAAVVAVAALVSVGPLLGLLSAGAEWLLPAGVVIALTGFIALLLLAVAIVDDHNDAGMRGGLWGLAFLLSGGLVALLWAFDGRLRTP